MAKKKGKKSNPMLIVFILIGAVCGFFGAMLMDTLENGGIPPVIVVFYLMAAFLASFFVVPFIHEAGHLVMGLLTGYDFVSFRVGSLTIIKENGKLVRRKFNISGTGGQCILSYRMVSDPEHIPWFWYHFGGVFFNFLTVAFCVPVIVFTKNIFILVAAALLAIMSAAIGAVNLIPTKATGIGTDGYNLLLMKKSPADRSAMYKLMLINAMQYQGTRLEDIPKEIMTFSTQEKQSTTGAALAVVEANLLMNRHDFKAAEEAYRAIAENENTFEVYKNECRCEILFCMIMNGKTAREELESIYDKDLKKYIALTGKTYIMRKRLMYAYDLLVEKNPEKASAEYDLARRMEKTYPAKGEYLSEMALIEYVTRSAAC